MIDKQKIFNELKVIRTEMEQSLVDWPHEHFDRLQELIGKLREELKVIRDMLEDDTGAGQSRLQELIWKLGEELND